MVKPDALAHLADALLEDIIAVPPHQLAMEELADAGRSRDLVFRFDDILAEEASAAAVERPPVLQRNAMWNLADALREDIADQPDEDLHEVTDGRGYAPVREFDDILRRASLMAGDGLTLPPNPAPVRIAYYAAVVSWLLERLIAPLRNRAAMGALATATAVIVVAVIHHQPSNWMPPQHDPVASKSVYTPDAAIDAAPPAVADGANAGLISTARPSIVVAAPPSRPAILPPRHVALVIGNAAYRGNDALKSPRHDAAAVAEALRQTGFTVQLWTDLDRDGMEKALLRFSAQANHADWALVYFAGHGIRIDGINYVVPIDAKLADERDVAQETVSYEGLLNAVNGAKALRLVILDASRDNRLVAGTRGTMASMASTASAPQIVESRGALTAPPEARPGTLVVSAAQDGEVSAEDTDGDSSPFTRALVKELKELPDRNVRSLLDAVTSDVWEATSGRQHPVTYGSLPAQDFFFPAAKETRGPPSTLVPR